MKKILVEVPYIDWDVDEEEDLYSLPKNVKYEFDRTDFDCQDTELQDDVENKVADKLSDDYGYCHKSFEIQITYV